MYVHWHVCMYMYWYSAAHTFGCKLDTCHRIWMCEVDVETLVTHSHNLHTCTWHTYTSTLRCLQGCNAFTHTRKAYIHTYQKRSGKYSFQHGIQPNTYCVFTNLQPAQACSVSAAAKDEHTRVKLAQHLIGFIRDTFDTIHTHTKTNKKKTHKPNNKKNPPVLSEMMKTRTRSFQNHIFAHERIKHAFFAHVLLEELLITYAYMHVYNPYHRKDIDSITLGQQKPAQLPCGGRGELRLDLLKHMHALHSIARWERLLGAWSVHLRHLRVGSKVRAHVAWPNVYLQPVRVRRGNV
jgi:hypothetical protein